MTYKEVIATVHEVWNEPDILTPFEKAVKSILKSIFEGDELSANEKNALTKNQIYSLVYKRVRYVLCFGYRNSLKAYFTTKQKARNFADESGIREYEIVLLKNLRSIK